MFDNGQLRFLMVFRSSKKGVSAAFKALMGVIVMLFVIVIVAFIIKSISDISSESAEDVQCKASVMAYARLLDMPVGSEKADASTINCPTKYVTVESGTAKEMNRDIANLMVECWDNFGRGDLMLFDAADEKFCVICSVFEFEDKSARLTGLPLFMMTERAPIKVDGRRPTYDEFLTGRMTDPDVVDRMEEQDMSFLDGSHRYAVMFTYYKESYWSKVKSAIAGGLIGAATVVVAGAIVVASGGSLTTVAGAVLKYGITTAFVVGGAVGGASSEGGVTTPGADWHAQVILAIYDSNVIGKLGCETLPVSQLDPRFR